LNEHSPVHDRNGDTVPLRQYIEALIEERDKAVKEALRQMEQRLSTLNELRAEVSKDRNLFLTRDKYDSEHGALEDRVERLFEEVRAHQGQHVTREKYDADLSAIKTEVRALDKKSASQDAVTAYKKLMYAAIGTGLLAFGIAFFNLVTKGGA